jgi:hypothetical protein
MSENLFSVPSVFKCDKCRGELYDNELVHLIDGYIICPECFEDFAFEYFEDKMTAVGDIPEKLRGICALSALRRKRI